MNQRKAKQLRREAKQIAAEQGLDVTTRMSESARYTVKHHTRVMQHKDETIPYTVYTAKLAACLRSVYKQLKKGV